jgi:hypothetical protein
MIISDDDADDDDDDDDTRVTCDRADCNRKAGTLTQITVIFWNRIQPFLFLTLIA